MPNRLIKETSPYLLQHAHNPVDWYPWGEEALDRAKKEDKPILVSIGYSACHWCHVMEKESFEDDSTAKLMNEKFINIKIDREERPDLDHIYMDAVQAITGSGGWPLNVFLTPEAKPFYGGTYFPPTRAFNRSSWKEVLMSLSRAFSEQREEINKQAETLTEHLRQANEFGFAPTVFQQESFNVDTMDTIAKNLMSNADREWGGFGAAPKFPQTSIVKYLLNYHWYTGEKTSFDQALLSLDKMIEGGIYDQAGGGFARYSTDKEWLAPHFEKMLYDNALILSTISDALKLTGKKRYAEVIEETIHFVEREMKHPDGGFYAALDADSEGIEGKFYVWSYDEIKTILGTDAELFSEFYDITPSGNWEHTNIMRVLKPLEDFASEKKISVEELEKLLDRGRQKLMSVRSKRVRPGLDDKILLGWNALMNSCLSQAFSATSKPEYLSLARQNMTFILNNMRSENGLFHTWKNGQPKYQAYLDDHAFLIEALLELSFVTGETNWLEEAEKWIQYVIDHFSDPATGFFYYTDHTQTDVIIRKKEIYDGATPSGNALMAVNLLRAGIIFDKADWRERSWKMVNSLSQVITRYPGSFGIWANLLQEFIMGTLEIVIIGPDERKLREEVLQAFLPGRVVMSSAISNDKFSLLVGKSGSGRTAIFLCKNFACDAPVFSAGDLLEKLNQNRKVFITSQVQ